MFYQDLKLGNLPHKLTKDTILLQNEKCIIKVTAGTLTLPILIDNTPRGHFFAGNGEFTLDTIIETARGAVGKPTVKELNQPFLMFGENSSLSQNLAPAADHDLSNMGYKSAEDFLKTANNALDSFTHKRHGRFDFDADAHIFAFANQPDKWDVLISKGDKLVYSSKEKVFISKNQAESISVQSGNVLVAKRGKTVVIDRGNILVDRDES